MSKLESTTEFESIKSEIENVFGRRILSSRDCIELSDEIYRKTQKQLNPNTLRRIFGLVKAEYPPSRSTLSILSKYCGFYSVDEAASVRRKTHSPDSVEYDQMLNYVVALFLETPVEDHYDKTFLSLIRQTISFLNQNAVLSDRFINMVAKTKNGQDFYFEYFVNIDKLNSYYGNGIRYYQNEKRTDEGFIFANSILVLKYWLNNDDEKVMQHMSELYNQKMSADVARPAVQSRYFAARLFHAHILSLNVDEILIDLYKYYTSAPFCDMKEEVLYFEYVVSEALVLTGHFHDALHYLGQFRKTYVTAESANYYFSLHNFKLMEALAFYHTNELTKANKAFDEIRACDFSFLSKKFAAILYMKLTNELKRKSIKSPSSMETLIVETGFHRLRSVL